MLCQLATAFRTLDISEASVSRPLLMVCHPNCCFTCVFHEALCTLKSLGRGRGQGPNGGPVFDNQGECQSEVIRLRNTVRRGTTVNLPGSAVNGVCKLITSGPLEGLFELVLD